MIGLRTLPLVLTVATALGCSRSETTPLGTQSAALRSTPVGAEQVLLDVDGQARLVGTILPTLPNSDMGLRLKMEPGERQDGLPEVVATAAFSPHGLVWVTPNGELSVGGTVLDTEVDGTLAVSPDGPLAWPKGHMPDQELWVWLGRGAPQQRTTGMAPVWSPAWEADGSLVFASARSGVPALWRLTPDGTTSQLNNRGIEPTPSVVPTLEPTPAGLSPMRAGHGIIAFETQDRIVVLHATGKPLLETDGRYPFWSAPGELSAIVGGLPAVVWRQP